MAAKTAYLIYKALSFVKDNWEFIVPAVLISFILCIMIIPIIFSIFLPHTDYNNVIQYKNIADKANIPFDQLLMVDIIKHNREDYQVTEKGLITAALDFFVLTVDEYEKEYLPTPTPAPGVTPTPGYRREYELIHKGTYTYDGSSQILSFLSGAGYPNILSSSFSQILDTISRLDRSEEYSISIKRKSYKELLSGYDEDIVRWAEEMIENGIVREMYK